VSRAAPLALILAAGAGKRLGMGMAKPLLPLPSMPAGEGTFIERHLRLLAELKVEAFAIVPGPDLDSYRFLARDGVTLVGNPNSASSSGSTVSLRVGLDALREREAPLAKDLIIMDCDIIYERSLLARVIEGGSRTCLFVTPSPPGDDEEVRVHGTGVTPRLVGKGLPVAMTANLENMGESVGIIRVGASDVELLCSVTSWLVGRPPANPGYGFSKQLSEHEEIWQYFCTIGRMSICRLPAAMAFSECDTKVDYQHIVANVLPRIREREGIACST